MASALVTSQQLERDETKENNANAGEHANEDLVRALTVRVALGVCIKGCDGGS